MFASMYEGLTQRRRPLFRQQRLSEDEEEVIGEIAEDGQVAEDVEAGGGVRLMAYLLT